jgi:hypothetical protein
MSSCYRYHGFESAKALTPTLDADERAPASVGNRY